MKISIVTAYFNRKNLFLKTLESISSTNHDDFELIVVDDGSDEEHKLDDILQSHNFLKLIRLNKEDKWYVNSCIPFNIGLKEAKGDIIILQNPECYHVGDIISHAANNLKYNEYFSYGCYSLDQRTTEQNNNYMFLEPNQRGASINGDLAWYNHSTYRPTGYHFTSAIHHDKLRILNGFDERYSMGYEYDDNEFLHRVKKICNFKYIDKPYVLHQYHGDSSKKPNFTELSNKNRNLFLNVTCKENLITVNI